MISRTLARLATLRWRLTLFYVALLAVLLGGFSLFVYNRFQDAQTQNTISRLADMAALFQPPPLASDELKAAISMDKLGTGTPDDAQKKLAHQRLDEMAGQVAKSNSIEGLYVAVLDADGRPIATNQPNPDAIKIPNIVPHLRPVLRPVPQQPDAKIPLPDPRADVYQTDLEITMRTKLPAGVQGDTYTTPGIAYVTPVWGMDKISISQGLPPDGYLALVAPMEQDSEALRQLGRFLTYGMIGALLLALLLGLPLARLGLRPLERIARVADEIGDGALDRRVELPRRPVPEGVRDEVRQLGTAFNTMLDKIQAAFAAQQRSEARTRRFAADASHELRSPLTVLGGYLDVLMMGARDDPAQAEHILRAMKSENDRLSRLVVDLLLLTRIDANGAAVLRVEPVNVATLAEQAGENMRLIMGSRDFSVEVAPEADSARVLADPDHLYRVLSNLLDNAVRYTPETGKITLSVEAAGDRARLVVEDTGCGIEPDQLPRVFDRFYRADASRNRQTGNAGLGLAICKSIVEAHRGSISVASVPGEGTRFTIDLPMLPSPSAQDTKQLQPVPALSKL